MTRAKTAAIVSLIALVMVRFPARTPAYEHTQTSTGTSSTIQDKMTAGAGRSAFVKVCSDCHDPESALSQLRARDEWQAILDQMAQYGAEGTDGEFQQILDYLDTNFSPIHVNTATAKHLESTLDIPATVAEAIVAYRRENGGFKALDDLKKVPGLDPGKVDARKGRLFFSP